MLIFNPGIYSDPSRKRLRQPMVIMLFLLVSGFVITLLMIFLIAHELNNSSDAEDAFLLRKIITLQQESIISHTTDNAIWGEAYKNLHEKVNLDWAWKEQNLGASLYETFGYDGIFVISPQGKTVYSIIDGSLRTESIQDWMGMDPREAIKDQLHKSGGAASAQFIMAQGKPVLISAAWITPGSDSTVSRTSNQYSTLLFVIKMSGAKLNKMGEDYGIANLHYDVMSDVYKNATNILPVPANGSNGILTWQSDEPGRELIVWLLPMTILLFFGMFFSAIVQLRSVFRIAESSDENIFMLQQSQIALLDSERRFRDVAETTADWIWETDDNLKFNWLSSRFSIITGYSSSLWIDRSLQDFLIEGQKLLQSPQTSLALDEYTTLTRCRYYSAQKCIRYCDLSIRRVELTPGKKGFRGTVTDVTLEVEAEEKAKYLAFYDDLTGLPNRAQMKRFLSGQLETPLNGSKPLTVIMIDLDKFKPVNDIYGHLIGDAILHQVSSRFRACVGDSGFTARLGGDEFVIIMSDITREQVNELCNDIIEKIKSPFNIDGIKIVIGVSLGISVAPMDADNITDLLRYADFALYKAKNGGGNKYEFYHKDLSESIVQRREMENQLREAIHAEQFALVYQPRYDTKMSQVTGVEALVRWNHPTLGVVFPDQFIPLAEESGLIKDITDWVLKHACQDMKSYFSNMRVSVNISPSEFNDANLAERVCNILNSTGLESRRLEIEVTENALVKNPENALKTMHELHQLGIKFHVDDFGSGYASFGYLNDFPFDGLKLDKSFVFAMHQSDNSLKIIQNLISLGSAYSLIVTAEGVETAQQMEQLMKFNCDSLQGYHIGKPIGLTQLSKAYPDL
ncbi:bifunctional diguanylate cyclase/phosphodiesterase [Pantoea cypripedii]|uniref:Diguanylate cyclase n=1 Tax=Pantoea cypripedii TaxID=55209 RepID=A0A6B9G6N1_PANCY|nr:EAL domain-containing protein [Pantoea cypripedii]QGY32362.1 diguanylate cyclase [Pantoea cypripedii]